MLRGSLSALLRAPVHCLGRAYISHIVKSEAATQKARPINERPIELSFVFDAIIDLQPTRILDVGTGQSPLPALLRNCGAEVTAVDNVTDYWSQALVNRHWHLVNDDIRAPMKVKGTFDLVTCISVIEHIDDHEGAFLAMSRFVRPGGHLIVTCPFNEHRYVPDVYALPDYVGDPQTYKCSSYNREILTRWVKASGLNLVRQDYWAMWEGDVWRQHKRLPIPRRAATHEPHQLSCMLFEKPMH